jgi:hypothetical protein
MVNLILKLLICIALACLLSACGSTGSQRAVKVVVEVGANCEHLEDEEWRDCMVEEAIRLGEKKLEEASD